MNRCLRTACCLGLVLSVCQAVGGESPPVESAQLKGGDLEGLTKSGAIGLVGFSWEGEPRSFDVDFGLSQVAAPEAGDLSFSILGKGASSVCVGFRQLASGGKSLKKTRLTFRSAEGAAAAFKLSRLTVQHANCEAKPWSAVLVAEAVSPIAESAGGRKPKKAEAARLEVVGSRG